MASPAPVGSDVSAGTYRCTNCGYELSVQSVQSLPPCPECSVPTGGKRSLAAIARAIRTQIKTGGKNMPVWFLVVLLAVLAFAVVLSIGMVYSRRSGGSSSSSTTIVED